MSRRSKPSKTADSLLGKVAELGGQEATGVLTVESVGRPPSRVYLMGGDIVACNAADDEFWLRRQLIGQGWVTSDVLDTVADRVASGQDLSDLLVRQKHVGGAEMMQARATLFRDSFLWASSGASPALRFEAQEMVFPQNMQFGVDRERLAQEARSWLDEVADALAILNDDGPFLVSGERSEAVDPAAWERLSRPTSGTALVMSTGAFTREAALRVLARLWSEGVLRSEESVRSDAAAHQAASAAAQVAAALAEIDAMESESAEFAAIENDADAESIELDLERPQVDDYDRAARGDFIKSYAVLDKVDLSGVAVLGAGGGPTLEGLLAIELGDDDGSADEDDEDDDAEGADDDEDDHLDLMLDALGDDLGAAVPDTASQLPLLAQVTADVAHPETDDFDIFDDAVEEIAELHVFEDLSMSDVGLTAELVDDEPEEAGVLATADSIDLSHDGEGLFSREELRGFHERIDIFNNIFRIIYGTFSEHIGADNARQRFNALLSSNQRQYPELFADILVGKDGTVQAAPLVNNLSSCTAGDYGSLLHQGLYELIFSHLYDAKDMLPGDVESGMMERILVFERQLHSS